MTKSSNSSGGGEPPAAAASRRRPSTSRSNEHSKACSASARTGASTPARPRRSVPSSPAPGYAVLRSLSDHGAIGLRQAADTYAMDAATASRQVMALIAEGLVLRRTADGDAARGRAHPHRPRSGDLREDRPLPPRLPHGCTRRVGSNATRATVTTRQPTRRRPRGRDRSPLTLDTSAFKRRGVLAVWPPSTVRSVPVIHAASSLAEEDRSRGDISRLADTPERQPGGQFVLAGFRR